MKVTHAKANKYSWRNYESLECVRPAPCRRHTAICPARDRASARASIQRRAHCDAKPEVSRSRRISRDPNPHQQPTTHEPRVPCTVRRFLVRAAHGATPATCLQLRRLRHWQQTGAPLIYRHLRRSPGPARSEPPPFTPWIGRAPPRAPTLGVDPPPTLAPPAAPAA
eukprot:2267919-Prymnesium_polylepis.1